MAGLCEGGNEHTGSLKAVCISLRDRIFNRKLQEITASENIGQRAAAIKWKWGGHVARQQLNRWTQITTMWTTIQAGGPKAGREGDGQTSSSNL
ncbi:hypothetical protein ANN_01246 [Periplaneta americana]|uniref:Uncharacterized protein n=1 Tax=Periplaneta americana TaxID=6978 RepID=A0ABQ8TW25_PERAM|nr:hypothetical protein ANN_01246 [Periplaneta americana]